MERGHVMGYPKDPNIKGLAAVTYHPDEPSWEFDIAAVPPGEDCTEISDWHRRHGWANKKGDNLADAARAGIDSVPLPPGTADRGG